MSSYMERAQNRTLPIVSILLSELMAAVATAIVRMFPAILLIIAKNLERKQVRAIRESLNN